MTVNPLWDVFLNGERLLVVVVEAFEVVVVAVVKRWAQFTKHSPECPSAKAEKSIEEK